MIDNPNTPIPTSVHLADGVSINDTPVLAGLEIALQPIGPGLTAVTLTLYADDLTIDWKNLDPNIEIIAPDELMARRDSEIQTEEVALPGWVYDHPDVWTNPRRQGGSPCVRGTRIKVDIILNLMAGPEGMTDGQVREVYPTVSAEQLTRLRAAYEKNGETDGNS